MPAITDLNTLQAYSGDIWISGDGTYATTINRTTGDTIANSILNDPEAVSAFLDDINDPAENDPDTIL